jgi:hypothetical protein
MVKRTAYLAAAAGATVLGLIILALVAGAVTEQGSSEQVTHTGIRTTVFWVGETANADNGGIPNAESAWDDHWLSHYGGVDAPQPRTGNLPAGFVPQENPYYFALPYNDISEQGSRKPSADKCLPTNTTSKSDRHSWCKNSWIAISYHGKTAYAQWEDVGPFEEDDSRYVFGEARPRNTQGEKAGLDVSPAVQGYLGIKDVDNTAWRFVKPTDVPEGPWKARITRSVGYTVDEST